MYLERLAQIESGGNPKARNPNSGALGLFQFIPSTAKQYGLTDPTDPNQAIQAVQRFTQDNANILSGKLGRAPSEPELYLAHQQGAGGALKLLSNPDVLASDLVGQKAVIQNGGKPDMTAGQFAQHVMQTYDPNLGKQPSGFDKFMNGVGEAIIPSAHADDLSSLSDEELLQAAKAHGVEVNTPVNIQQNAPTIPDLSQLSDEQLMQEAQKHGVNVEQKPNYLRALIDTGAQGLTFGTADEIGGGIESLITGKPYENVVNDTRQRLQKEREAYPVSTFLADVAGGFALPVGGLAKLAKSSPSVVSALKALAEGHPIAASGAIGAASGAARGAGEGTDEQSRMENAGIGALFGAGAGAAGGAIGGKISSLLEQQAAKKAAQKTLQSPLEEVAAQAAPEALSPLTQSTDELFPKTAGQRTQNADIQRLENNAIAGTISPDAQQAGFNMLNRQNESFKGLISKLGGDVESGRDINGILDDVSKTIQTRAGEAKQNVNNAYDLAKQGKGVKISKAEIQQGLWKNIADIRREGGYDITQMPNAKNVLQRLGKYSQDRQGSTLTYVKLGELENFRKQASQAIQRTTDPTEKKFIGDVVRGYDNFMENTAANAVDIGDKNAINAFKAAVSARRDYGKLFESNKLVEDIVGGKKSLDDTVKSFMGTGAIKGKSEMANNLDAVLTASGKEKDNIRSDLQNAFMKRLYDRSTNGKLEGQPDAIKISPAKLKTELENLFVHQKQFATKLYGEEAVTTANKAIKELSLINSQQPSTRNASGSGEMIQRYLMPIMEQAPVVGKLVAGSKRLGEIAKQQTDTRKAVQALSGEVPKLKSDFSFKPKSTVWGSSDAVGALTGGSLAGQGTRKEIPVIDIYKGAK